MSRLGHDAVGSTVTASNLSVQHFKQINAAQVKLLHYTELTPTQEELFCH